MRIEFEVLDLAGVSNVQASDLPRTPPVAGDLRLRGIPFAIGIPSKGEHRYLGLGEELKVEPVEIAIDRPASHLLFAFSMLDSPLRAGGPFGYPCMELTIKTAAAEHHVTVREGFEIGALPAREFEFPMLAWPDRSDNMAPRREGAWIDWGMRQMEVEVPHPQDFYLWAWKNPARDDRVVSLRIEPNHARFIIGGITVGDLDEEPFGQFAARTVRLELLEQGQAHRSELLSVLVDRGAAGYVWPLPLRTPEEFLDATAGWGEPEVADYGRAYVDIAASSSATVSVMSNDLEIGSFEWKAVGEDELNVADRLSVRLADPGRNWVRVTIVDDATGEPIPCRVHFRSAEGVPYQPVGHQHHAGDGLGEPKSAGWWAQELDLGGDVRLGATSYAYIDGRCEGWLPRGDVLAEVARGFEYEPLRTRVTIEPGQQELTLRLKRLVDMSERRYFSGDTHVHALSTQGAHVEAAGEGLNIINLLILQLGHVFAGTEEFTGKPSISDDGETIVFAGQEPRQHVLGHLAVLGPSRLIVPWATGGQDEGEMGSALESTMSRWADECHEVGGTAVIAHMPYPHGEFAAVVATQRADAVEWIMHNPIQAQTYYRCLNLGYQLPLVGGTDKISADNPVGIFRTYVQIPDGEEFSFESWCKYLREGRTFMTSGPLLDVTYDGMPVGSTISMPAGGGTVTVEASAISTLPFRSLEVIKDGEVVAHAEEDHDSFSMSLSGEIGIENNSWLAVRCGGPNYFDAHEHFDYYKRGVIAHTSPTYVTVGEGPWSMYDKDIALEFRALIEAGIQFLRTRTLQWPEGSVTHHHGLSDHTAYLEEPFQDALRKIDSRISRGM
jgi:hypothetical protein